MGNDRRFFSVVIPSFNDPRITEAIQSVQAQTYPRELVEIVVQDGGSGVGLLEGVRATLDPTRDKLRVERDGGIFDGINRGIHAASGEVVVVIGSDDRFSTPSALARVDEAMRGNRWDFVEAAIEYTDASWNPRRRWLPSGASLRALACGRQVAHFGFFASKNIYERLGVFDTEYRVSADYEFFLRLAKARDAAGWRGGAVDEVLVQMKLGGNSSRNFRNVLRGNIEIARAMLRHAPFLLPGLALKPYWKALEFARVRRVLHS